MESNANSTNKRRCVGKERSRVTRACDTCKRKKLRCSGTLPCSLCHTSGQSCEYNADYTRGKLPSIPPLRQADRDGNDVAEQRCEEPSVQIIGKAENNPSVPEDENVNASSCRNSPEAHQTDMEGHYVGPSSGVSFLIRVQRRLHENITFPPNSAIFNFGDAPLPKYDPSFLVIPSKAEGKLLLDRYFNFAFPTHRFLHQGQMEGWLEEFYNCLHDPAGPRPGHSEVRALLLMVFAQATQYLSPSDRDTCAVAHSAVYFGASEHHLTLETGPIRLTSVQARLAQCFFLLSESRINHCWSLFGTTARLAIAIGLHRRRRREHVTAINLIDQECRKRVFWSAYSLDGYLSAALGRPRIFHDEEVDQELPSILNDNQITSTAILPASSPTQSVMLAPVYHSKLSKIISGILRDMYGIRRLTLQSQLSAATKYGAELSQWRNDLSTFLDLPNIDLLMLPYQRQYTVLNLAFYHAQILLYRPFVLRNSAVLAMANRRDNQPQLSIQKNIQNCLEAAMKIIGIVHDMCDKGRMYQAFWFTHYYTFSAIVVLYIHVIQSNTRKSALSTDSRFFQAGEQGHNDLATCGAGSSFAQRYVMVLEELRKEAQESARPHQAAANQNVSVAQSDESTLTLNDGARQGDHQYDPEGDRANDMSDLPDVGGNLESMEFPPGQLESQPWLDELVDDGSSTSYLAELTNWGEFDSLVLTGLGELEHLI